MCLISAAENDDLHCVTPITVRNVSDSCVLFDSRLHQYKLQEPILLLGKDRFADVDICIRVKDGGHTSQIYANR